MSLSQNSLVSDDPKLGTTVSNEGFKIIANEFLEFITICVELYFVAFVCCKFRYVVPQLISLRLICAFH